MQGRGERDVVDVVAGRARERAGLPPSGHAPIDERRVALKADVGAEPQALHHARAKAFDEHIAAFGEPQNRFHARRVLQIHRDALAAPRQYIGAGGGLAGRAGPVHAHHLGTHIGEHHAAERPRPDAL